MPPTPRRSVTSKPRHTYGQERSFLDQEEVTLLDEDEDQLRASTLSPLKRLSLDLSPPPAIKRVASGSAFRPVLSGANSQHGSSYGGESSEQGAILKASHELREAGQSHRFKDEIEYILEGVRSRDRLSVRRASCLDLVRSMLKQDFVAYIRSYQYMSIIFEAIYEDRDPDTGAFRDLTTIRSLIPFLCMSLDMEMDPMATMPSARQEIVMFNDIKDAARQSGIIQKGQKVLIKSIALVNMIKIVNQGVSLQDKETLSVIEHNPRFLGSVVEILIEDLAWIKQPLSRSDVSLPDLLDIDRVENCLGILERLALVSNTPASMLADRTSLFPLLVQLVTLCRAHALQNLQRADSLNLMLHILRLLINVTNGFERCSTNLANSGSIQVLVQNFVQFYHHCRNYCPENTDMELESSKDEPMWIKTSSRTDSGLAFDTFSQESICADSTTDSPDELHPRQVGIESIHLANEAEINNDANGWYDMLLLSLGLLINILETSPHCRELITSTAIVLDCMAIGNCFHAECECEKSTETLERLVQIYNTEAIISDMTENQVLAAHLALLIGCVVEGSPENEDRLYRTIQGHSLEPMLDLLKEFVTIHKTVQDERLEPLLQEQAMMMAPSRAASTSDTMASGMLAEKAAETEQSFFRVIEALQSMEQRFKSFKSRGGET